jgi:hypothetical protein
MKFIRLAVLTTMALIAMAAHFNAHASPVSGLGYVCKVTLNPANSLAAGKFGFISLVLSTEKNCGGTVLSSGRILSTDATLGEIGFRYSSPALMALYKSLFQSIRTASVVVYEGDTGDVNQSRYYNRFAIQAIP